MKTENFNLPNSASEAVELQKQLVKKLVLHGDPSNLDLVAGADVSSYGQRGMMCGAIVVWNRKKQVVIAQATATVQATFPYIPGLLAFRELPALLEAFKRLDTVPEVIICDGQGIAHPRGIGIAAHLGLLLGIPTIGCGKTRLVGEHEEPGIAKGSVTLLEYRNKVIGQVVRTRNSVKPLFISPGHLCGIPEASRTILSLCTKYRLPEPIRAAHNLAGMTLANFHHEQ